MLQVAHQHSWDHHGPRGKAMPSKKTSVGWAMWRLCKLGLTQTHHTEGPIHEEIDQTDSLASAVCVVWSS